MGETMLRESIIIDEIFFGETDIPEKLIEVINRLANTGYYKAIETGISFDSSVNKKIRAIKERNGLFMTQWLTRPMIANNLDLSAPESEIRKPSVAKVLEYAKYAAEAGADRIAVISGKNVEHNYQAEAIAHLRESLFLICRAMKPLSIGLLIEPLDRYVHKKQLIGSTRDAVQVVQSLRDMHFDVGIAWDSAHTALNTEDLYESLSTAEDQILNVHLANAVLDPNSKLYGDFHIPAGEPGFLTIDTAINIVKKIKSFKTKDKPLNIAIEMRLDKSADMWEFEKASRIFLDKVLQGARNDI